MNFFKWCPLVAVMLFTLGCGSHADPKPVTEITADQEAEIQAEQERIEAAERANM